MNLILSDVEEHTVIVDQSDRPARVSCQLIRMITLGFLLKTPTLTYVARL